MIVKRGERIFLQFQHTEEKGMTNERNRCKLQYNE
jgi:hypothetical protein